MNKDRDLELTARAGEADDVAAREATDDERAKQQHAHHGGTLEVSDPYSRMLHTYTIVRSCDQHLTRVIAIHQHGLNGELLLRAAMLLGSCCSDVPVCIEQWRSCVYRLWQYLGRFRYHARSDLVGRDGIYVSALPHLACDCTLIVHANTETDAAQGPHRWSPIPLVRYVRSKMAPILRPYARHVRISQYSLCVSDLR